MALKVVVQNLCRSLQLCTLKTVPALPQGPSYALYNVSYSFRCLSADSSFPKTGRKPLGPYIMFASEKFAGMQKANPGVKITDLAAMMGQMWRLMPENEKEPYRARYATEKANNEMWKATLSEDEKKKILEDARIKRRQKMNKRHRKLNRELNRPVPSDVNPFLLFVKASKVERGDAPLAQYVKGLSEHWKKMPEEDKEEYVTAAKANSILHRQKVAEWKKRMLFEGHTEVLKLKPPKKPAASKKNKKIKTTRAAAKVSPLNSKEKTATSKSVKKPKDDLTSSDKRTVKSKVTTLSSDNTSS